MEKIIFKGVTKKEDAFTLKYGVEETVEEASIKTTISIDLDLLNLSIEEPLMVIMQEGAKVARERYRESRN